MGHGSGEQYIRGNCIIKQIDHCAVSLLMGCSSGSLELEGEFDPSGMMLSYLIAGWSVEFFLLLCMIFNGFIFLLLF